MHIDCWEDDQYDDFSLGGFQIRIIYNREKK